MVRCWLILSTLAACGRLGFDAVPGGVGPPDASSVEVAADLAALPCEIDRTMSGMLPFSDQIRVAYSAGVPHVIDIHHLSDTLHEVHAYRLSERDGTLVGTDLGSIYALADITGLSIEPVGSDHVMVFSDPLGVRMHVLRVDESFANPADMVVGDFAFAQPPYARSSAGRMLVGVTSSDVVQVRALDASFAPLGSPFTLGSPAYDATIAPAGADFLVAWGSAGTCRFARVNLAGTIVAGPLGVDPGTTCARPAAAVLGTGRIAYVVHDVIASETYNAFAGTIDAALTNATPPVALGAPPSFASQLLVAGDLVRIPVFNNGAVRIAEMMESGAISQIGAEIGAVTSDTLWIEQVAGASILFRVEGRQLVVRRLCR